MSEIKKSNFIKGAITLSAAGILSKIMGFAYRIVLPRMIGAEGVGIYQLAYPIYTILLVISTSGIPIALAKLISKEITNKDYRSAYNIFKTCKKLSIIVGLLLTFIMIVMASPIIKTFNWDPRSIYSILALAPAVFFVTIMSSFRGFFQGLQNMVPTAYSQIIEQFIRIITMLLLVQLLLPYGIEFAAAGATFGAVFGAIAGLILLIYIYLRKKNTIWEPLKQKTIKINDFWANSKKIIYLAAPITFGALITPLMSFIDAAIVPARLQAAGFNNPLALYGHLTGMAMVLVHFPTIITLSLATSLVPAISEAFTLSNQNLVQSRAASALRLTILIALPAAVGLYLLSNPLTTLIFGTPDAAIPLRFVAWGVIFISLKQTTAAMLQGMGKVIIPARNLFIGATFNAIINYTLTGLPYFGIRGAALGTVTGFGVAAILNMYYVRKWTNLNFNYNKLLYKPIISVFIMSVAVLLSFKTIKLFLPTIIENYILIISTFSAILLGITVYSLTLLLLKEINYNDINLIPKIGPKLAELLCKTPLLEREE
ncbi:MAG: putative polysaccharide biosynthesis protein [Halanaerobiales bacterium]